MSVRGRTIAVALTPSSIEVGVVCGRRVVPAGLVEIERGAWASAWDSALRPLDGALASALEHAGASAGCPTRVYYQGADTIAEVYGLPATGSAALRAAGLALREAVPYPLEDNAHALRILMTDRTAPGGGARGGERTHVLAIAERDGALAALYEWAARAGLRVEALVPVCAGMIVTAARDVAGIESASAIATLNLGRQQTVIAAASERRLRLARLVNFGFDHLVDAYARVDRTGGDRSAALRRLFVSGVPRSDAVIDESTGLRGSDLLPLIQPVLQRCAVELKQTARFGLSDADLLRMRIRLIGPGAAIPGLAAALSSHTELHVDALPGAGTEAAAGVLRQAVEDAGDSITFLPRQAAQRREARRVRTAAGAGVGLALLVMLGEGARAWTGLERAATEAAGLRGLLAQAQQAADERAAAEKIERLVRAAEAALEGKVAGQPHWGAFLAELTRITPAEIRLTDLSGDTRGSVPTMRLSGAAYQDGAGEDGLGEYIRGLESCPLVRGVELGGTELGTFNGRAARSFQLRVSLHALPAASLADAESKP